MKKILILLFCTQLTFTIYGQQKGFGLGLIIGEPAGISAKYWTTTENAFNLGLGYSFATSNSVIDFHFDYAFHNEKLIKSEEKLIVYYGPGARLKIMKDNTRLGIRGVAGIVFIPENTPIDLFFELAPILDIIPGTKFGFAGGVGIRYFFN